MEGAVDAGERAALEVIEAFARDHARQEISMLSDSLTGKCTLT
jgi:hypothetical protein